MSGQPVAPLALPLPGWYGKLPGLGDFAGRRLHPAVVQKWDDWLQEGLRELRQSPDWLDAYLNSPLWCFALAAGVLGPQRWLGVMVPSVDMVGRYFPLTLFFSGEEVESLSKSKQTIDDCWALGASAALYALEHDLDAAGLDAYLHQPPAQTAPLALPALIHWPQPGQSLWLAADLGGGSLVVLSDGLPREADFQALWRAPADAVSTRPGVL